MMGNEASPSELIETEETNMEYSNSVLAVRHQTRYLILSFAMKGFFKIITQCYVTKMKISLRRNNKISFYIMIASLLNK